MSMFTEAPNDHDAAGEFLVALAGVVERDGAPSGLRGKLAIGLMDGESLLWWNARFGPEVTYEIDDRVAEDVEAALLIGRSFESSKLYGNTDLLNAFVRRYFEDTRPLQFRIGQLTNGKGARR